MATRRATSKPSTDAIAMLKADHEKVKKLFKQFEKLHEDESIDEAGQMARQICNELRIHTTVEDEIFYPEVRAAIDDDDLMNEADVEHASAKDLIAQIEGMNAGEDKFAAKVLVLGEYIDHHIKEEHSEMFPKAQKSGLDMKEIGSRMLARKRDLQAEMGMDDSDANAAGQNSDRKPRAPAHA